MIPLHIAFAFFLITTPTPNKPPQTVQEIIIELSEQYHINTQTALRIAECESNFNPRSANPHSTAKGVYQFINQTWQDYCMGDVYDPHDNITCFMQLYPQHPSWWECR